MRLIQLLAVVATPAILYGCANSASHQVVKKEKAQDDYMSCSDIRLEKRKVQAIVSGVEQDKQDMTGSDVVDGILWFPFNVIAKQSNYASATDAAEGRIENLALLEVERGCSPDAPTMAGQTPADKKVAEQVKQLNDLYKDGLLTQEEFLTKRKAALATLEKEDKPSSQSRSANKTRLGPFAYQAERAAEDKDCYVLGSSDMISKDGPDEFYQVNCRDREPALVKCTFGKCAALN